MTMSLDKGPALIGALRSDAQQLADNERVSDEQFHRTVGRMGLLMVDIAENAPSRDEAKAIATVEALRVSEATVGQHIVICRQTTGTPSTIRGAVLTAISRAPWPTAMLILAWLVLYHPPASLQHLLTK